MKKVEIILNEYDYTCTDGCCTTFGQQLFINGEEMFFDSQDTSSVVKEILTALGYKATVIYQYDGEEQYRL